MGLRLYSFNLSLEFAPNKDKKVDLDRSLGHEEQGFGIVCSATARTAAAVTVGKQHHAQLRSIAWPWAKVEYR